MPAPLTPMKRPCAGSNSTSSFAVLVCRSGSLARGSERGNGIGPHTSCLIASDRARTLHHLHLVGGIAEAAGSRTSTLTSYPRLRSSASVACPVRPVAQ